MKAMKVNLVAILALLAVIAVSAQETPVDLADLIRMRQADTERQLRARGFTQVSSVPTNNGSSAKWLNTGRTLCITVRTVNGRTEQILTAPPADCN